MLRWTICAMVSWCVTAAAVFATETPTKRFFYSGDGIVHLASEKNSNTFSGRYRNTDGSYRREALGAISAVFDGPRDPSRQVVSLRLIEYLDYLEDRLNPGAQVTLTSGYRAPKYNTNLRKRGALAAKASLHQYGMAADLIMEGVAAKRLWETVREVGFGGAGYYHGRTVHIDVGPARFWDEKTSGVGTGISDDNKLIGMVTDFDVYLPGEPISLRFIRMTAFPIGVSPEFRLVPDGREDGDPADGAVFRMAFAQPVADGCTQFNDIDQMSELHWQLPATTPSGRYRIRAVFCGNRWEAMPSAVLTPPFEVR